MTVKHMLDSYPRDFDLDADLLAEALERLQDCANTCTQCADACLSEPGLSPELAKCIRLDLDCADICETTSRVLSRQTEYDANVSLTLLEACLTVCDSCADECATHAGHMDHCRLCMESCRACSEVCARVMQQISA